MGAIHLIKIQTGPTGKSGPPQKVDQFFWLDRTDPLSFGPKFPEILVEWIAPIAPNVSSSSLLFKLFIPFFRYLYLYFWFYLKIEVVTGFLLAVLGVLRDPNHAWKLDC